MSANDEQVWTTHTSNEFVLKDVEGTMRTMTEAPQVVHVPVATGGRGKAGVREFYERFFIGRSPEDFHIELLSRTVGTDRLVDEMLISFTHDIDMPWILPGIAPTGRAVTIPAVAIVSLRDGLIDAEHIYWDQASVLAQVGALGLDGLPALAGEQASALTDEGSRLNRLIR